MGWFGHIGPPNSQLSFPLLYSYPFKKQFWETYIYNGKGGEWRGRALLFCVAKAALSHGNRIIAPTPNSVLPEFLEIVVPSFETGAPA